MSHFNFTQLVLSGQKPTMTQRENVARNALTGLNHSGRTLEVHAVRAVAATRLYSVVSFMKTGARFVSYVACSVTCRKAKDGYWLDFDCFLATKSTPPLLSDCPVELLEIGQRTGMPIEVDQDWLSLCQQRSKCALNLQSMKRGAVFSLTAETPKIFIGGEAAIFAVVINKSTVRYIAPRSGLTKDDAPSYAADHFELVPSASIPTFMDKCSYSEAGDLLFDLSGPRPQLKGILASGAKAKARAVQQRQFASTLTTAIQTFGFSERFSDGRWLA